MEYAATATMLQYDMIQEGLSMVKAISERYNGRLRSEGEVHMANNSKVFGTGSSFGEDESGDYYARPLSSWSVLLVLQGFIYNGPENTIGFDPLFHPDNHASFFFASEGWGLLTQALGDSLQTSSIEVKYVTVHLKKIILKVPDNKSVSYLSVTYDEIEQLVESSKRKGNAV